MNRLARDEAERRVKGLLPDVGVSVLVGQSNPKLWPSGSTTYVASAALGRLLVGPTPAPPCARARAR